MQALQLRRKALNPSGSTGRDKAARRGRIRDERPAGTSRERAVWEQRARGGANAASPTSSGEPVNATQESVEEHVSSATG